MKKILLAITTLFVLSVTAYAVSIEVTEYAAVAISDLRTVTSDDGFTKEHSISFMGPGLAPLMYLLPAMKDIDGQENRILEYKRGFAVSQPAAEDGKSKALFFECQQADGGDKSVSCNITLIVGIIPG
ncbi:hypothetical protein AZI86_00790 [Bdellovibrio bacteriovorus]|uniref:Uncharacterized protein n=1 Tax=Bdellovibrio bacteriovorus TaxID=959 RepID=A0A150WMP8_BDEBC|nr:hypothetical protein [Bdellovibrio bacteriovorus]KYG65646.1 hypothetical protein AZI86_00790 [Bdellovibrio bacteriovorus]